MTGSGIAGVRRALLQQGGDGSVMAWVRAPPVGFTAAIVMAPGGLVGRVVSVTPNSSRVLLISDATSQVGVAISRSRSMGFMRGEGSNRAIMQFFDKVPNVRKGDVVSTSPVSNRFPPGLPLGRVESVNLDKSPAPEAVVELTAPFNSLEWVMVYPHSSAAAPQPAKPKP